MKAWTFDELYGRDGQFLDGLDERKQAFVGEVPPNFHVWIAKAESAAKTAPKHAPGRQKKYPRLGAPAMRVGMRSAEPGQVLARLHRANTAALPRHAIRTKGPEIWEVRWHTCCRKTHDGKLVSSQCTLIVARNVRTGEVKYFLSNRVPGRDGWTLRRVAASGLWTLESGSVLSRSEGGAWAGITSSVVAGAASIVT